MYAESNLTNELSLAEKQCNNRVNFSWKTGVKILKINKINIIHIKVNHNQSRF